MYWVKDESAIGVPVKYSTPIKIPSVYTSDDKHIKTKPNSFIVYSSVKPSL
jgi:hypothetical protein